MQVHRAKGNGRAFSMLLFRRMFNDDPGSKESRKTVFVFAAEHKFTALLVLRGA
jgi:hypothetical protein